jgi:HK97 family phage major capsid protein
MADKVSELKQKRASLIAEARKTLDQDSAEARQEYERIANEIDDVEARIRVEEDLAARMKALAESELSNNTKKDEPNTEYRAAFESYLRNGIENMTQAEREALRRGKTESRDMSVGTSAAGGYTVPQEFLARLAEVREEQSGIRQAGAFVLSTGDGRDLDMPLVTAHGAAAAETEASSVNFTDDTFATVQFKAYKVARGTKVSVELLQDSAFDIASYVARSLGLAIGLWEGAKFETGAGTTEPTGIVTAAQEGATLELSDWATNDVLIADRVIDLIHSVPAPYRRGAAFLMNDAIVAILRKVKDANNHYIWEPSLQVGVPDRLFGYPIFSAPSMAAETTAGNSIMVYGDMSQFFIREAGGVVLARLNERFMDNLQVGFVAYARVDSNLVDVNAVKKLVTAD